MSGKKHLRRVALACAIGSLPVLVISIRFDAIGWWTHYPAASIAAWIAIMLYEHPRRYVGLLWLFIPMAILAGLLTWPSGLGTHAWAAFIGMIAVVLKEVVRVVKVQRILRKSEVPT